MKHLAIVMILAIALMGCDPKKNENANPDPNPGNASTSSTTTVKLEPGNAERGKELYTKLICNTCHSVDGSRLVGPSLKGIYNTKRVVLEDGKEKEVVADDAYLKLSISNPNAQIVKDYPAAMVLAKMPTEQETLDLIEYMKTIK